MNSVLRIKGLESMNKKAEKILHIATKLFIHEGVRKTTMDAIAEKANVSKMTIYKYFTDKDNLFLEVGKRIISYYSDKLNNIIATDEVLTKKLYAYLDAISDFINSGQFDLCMELAKYNQAVETGFKLYSQAYKNSMFALIDAGMKEGLFKDHLDREMIFYYIDMGIVYYQRSSEYRHRMINDSVFKQQFLSFYIGNIFVDGAKMLSVPDEVI